MKWKIIPKGNTTENYIVTEELNKHGYPERIAKSYKREYDNLIAAAPEMLDYLIAHYKVICLKCDEYSCMHDKSCDACKKLKELIESATGLKIEEVIKA